MKTSTRQILGLLLASLVLGGCATTAPHVDEISYDATLPLPPKPVEQLNGSLFQEEKSLVLFEDARARRVGDILTIVLVEQTSASKSAKTSTSKDSTLAMENPTIFGRNPSLNVPGNKALDLSLAMGVDSAQTFDGAGDSELSNALDGNIAVTIADVLSNGYLVVRGEKRLTINQGNEFIRISGIVRPSDVQSNNTVLSTLVADARITYTGEGDVADSSRPGAFTRFMNKYWLF